MGKKLTARQQRILEQGQNVLDSLQRLKRAVNTYHIDRYGYESGYEAETLDMCAKRFGEQLEYDVHHNNHKTRYINTFANDAIDCIIANQRYETCECIGIAPIIEEPMKEVIAQSVLYEEIMNTPPRGENFNKLMKQVCSDVQEYTVLVEKVISRIYKTTCPEQVVMAQNYYRYLRKAESSLKARNLRAVLDNDTELETLKTTLREIREMLFPSDNNNELNPIFEEIAKDKAIRTLDPDPRSNAVKKLQESQPRFLKLYDEIMAELEQ